METIAPARVLVVEDDPKTADLVALYLRHAGHRAEVVHTGDAGARRLDQARFDLLILDVMLPGVSGLELCQKAQVDGRTPVILLTARTREEERVAGLEMGADDYVTKPFSPRELMARVAAVLRRAPPGEGQRLVRGPLVIEGERRRTLVNGTRVDLTATEFNLLFALADKPGHARTRSYLVQSLPDGGRDALERTIDVHIRNLRRKLTEAGGPRGLIETVSGVGYRFSEDVTGAGT